METIYRETIYGVKSLQVGLVGAFHRGNYLQGNYLQCEVPTCGLYPVKLFLEGFSQRELLNIYEYFQNLTTHVSLGV